MDATKILADAIKTIGRTLPVGMEIAFWNERGDPAASMVIFAPDGSRTEYIFARSEPLPEFPLVTLLRESKLEAVLRDLVSSIELHTDCIDGRIDREPLGPYLEAADELLAEGWEADDSHPANRITSVPATASYPVGSLGEAVEA